MKKRLVVCLLALVLVLGLAIGANAAEGDLSVSVSADTTTIHPGNDVTLTVSIENNPTVSTINFQYDIPAGMVYKSGDLAEGVDATIFGTKNINTTGVYLQVNNGSSYSADGPIVTLVFTVEETCALGDVNLGVKTIGLVDTTPAEVEHTPSNVSETIKVDHSWVDHPAVESTCLVKGNNEYWTCSECSKIFNADKTAETTVEAETLDFGAHKLSEVTAKAETCTTDGNIDHWTCSVCGALFNDENGTTELTSADVTVEKIAHKNAEHHDAVSPSVKDGVQQVGNYEYWYCPDCGTYFKIDPTGLTEIDSANIYGVGSEGKAKVEYTKTTGDVDCNGSVTTRDGTFLIRYLTGDRSDTVMQYFGDDCQGKINADIDGNSSISTRDGTFLIRYLTGDRSDAVMAYFGDGTSN